MSGEQHVPTSEYVPSMGDLKRDYLAMRAEHYGFVDLYAQEWDRAIAAHDAEVRALPDQENVAGVVQQHRLATVIPGHRRFGAAEAGRWVADCACGVSMVVRDPDAAERWHSGHVADAVLALFGQEGQQ